MIINLDENPFYKITRDRFLEPNDRDYEDENSDYDPAEDIDVYEHLHGED